MYLRGCIILEWMLIGIILGSLHIACQSHVHSSCGPFSIPDMRPSGHTMSQDGDLLLAGLFPIGEYSSTKPCGDGVRSWVLKDVEAMVYAIDQINNQTDLLPNITLGYIIIDQCGKESTATARTMHLIPSLQDDNNTNCDARKQTLFYDVVGIVGGIYSGVSMSIASISTIFQIPQISPISTSAILSDKASYPYFLRVVPPDTYQSQAMIQLLAFYNWTYISTINSEGAYGSSAIKQVHRLSKSMGICIAYKREINHLTTAGEYRNIVRNLRMHSNAHVIVVFAFTTHMQKLLSAADSMGVYGEFIWIFGDSFSVTEEHTITYEKILIGSFFVNLHSAPTPAFEQHLKTVTTETRPNNHWLQQFTDGLFNCTWGKDSGKTPCTHFPNTPLDGALPAEVPFVIDSVKAFAYGLHKLVEQHCQGYDHDKVRLRQCISRHDLHSYLQKTSFIGSHGLVKFDENGDGTGTYDIHQLKGKDARGPRYVKVASWSKGDAYLNINTSEVSWSRIGEGGRTYPSEQAPESTCSYPCRPGEFIIPKEVKCCWECRQCRDNEITIHNATSCQQCPIFYWPDQKTFLDCFAIHPTYLKWDESVSLTISFLGLLGIVSTFVVGVFFVKHRHVKIVKATGREINCVIFAGIFCAFCTVFLFLAMPTQACCQMGRAGFNLAFTVEYAALLARVSRIFRIFNSAKKGKQRPAFISSHAQIAICGSLIALQVIAVYVSMNVVCGAFLFMLTKNVSAS